MMSANFFTETPFSLWSQPDDRFKVGHAARGQSLDDAVWLPRNLFSSPVSAQRVATPAVS